MSTFMIEGEWSGYHAGQRHVAHREYVSRAKFAEKVAAIGSIGFADGTSLFITVKPYRRADGKKLPEKLGYRSLIEDCVHYGVSSVDELLAAKAHVRLINAKPSDKVLPEEKIT